MGQFSAGRWVVGLVLYFIMFFAVVFTFSNGAQSMGRPITGVAVADPGFSTPSNQPFAQQNTCSGTPYYFCSSTKIDNDTLCNGIPGCYFNFNPIFQTTPYCAGVITTACERFVNQGNCTLVGCTWTDFTSPQGSGTVAITTTFDWSAVKNTILIMSGFQATIGIPLIALFIVNVFLFWIPFFMLLWSLYMALPFIN